MGVNLGSTLQRILDKKGITQEQLAEMAGIRRTDINALAKGRIDAGPGRLERIADALNVSVYDLGATRPIERTFATSLLGQIVAEIEQRPPLGDPSHLRELADELRQLASRVDAVAARQDAYLPPA